jgi:hypothetical protein
MRLSPRHDGPVPDALTAYLAATFAYAGFQWAIRVVVYPQLALVPAEAFGRYLETYQRRVTLLVGPLFGALVLTTLWVMVTDDVPLAGRVAAVLLLGVVLGVTGLAAVPLHSTLSRGWDDGAHRRLLRVDEVRVAAATASAVLAVALVLNAT